MTLIHVVGALLIIMGGFTMFIAHKHERLDRWSILGGLSYLTTGIVGILFASWWPIIAGTLLGAAISRYAGVAQDRRT